MAAAEKGMSFKFSVNISRSQNFNSIKNIKQQYYGKQQQQQGILKLTMTFICNFSIGPTLIAEKHASAHTISDF